MQYTSDGVKLYPGLRVFTIDCTWGTVVKEAQVYGNGWWYIQPDGLPGLMPYNGERLAVKEPF
jgi:hypothetical protein